MGRTREHTDMRSGPYDRRHGGFSSSSATLPRIVSAENDILVTEAGRRCVDLFSGNGAVWLGHRNPEVTAAVEAQMNRVWLTGGLPTPALDEAKDACDAFFPPSHRTVAIYSTGMEAAEFAIRVARAVTGRSGVIGFTGNMHGKSVATACLGWSNYAAPLERFRRLPYVSTDSEESVLS